MAEQDACLSWQVSIPENRFSPEEVKVVLGALYKRVNVPCCPGEQAAKKVIVNLGGIAKAGKNSITDVLEREFRRCKFKVHRPPESAEHEAVRRGLVAEPFVQQARHLAEIQCQVFDWAYSRDVHATISHRGLVDILYWYERDTRKGLYDRASQKGAQEFVYRILERDLVDAFFHLTCSPAEALRRRDAASLSSGEALRMAERDFAEANDIYEAVLEGIARNVARPLPIFRIDTTGLSILDATAEVLRHLLPALCQRFTVPGSCFMPDSPSLLTKEAAAHSSFEEQLKLRGRPGHEALAEGGWTAEGISEQEDVYLDLSGNAVRQHAGFDQLARIRRECSDTSGALKLTFHYKSIPRDRIFSFRNPLTYELTEEHAAELLRSYPTLTTLKKRRECFSRPGASPQSPSFTLHIDAIEGMGIFTEIRTFGSQDATHEDMLLGLAASLGFRPSDIVVGSYLGLALR